MNLSYFNNFNLFALFTMIITPTILTVVIGCSRISKKQKKSGGNCGKKKKAPRSVIRTREMKQRPRQQGTRTSSTVNESVQEISDQHIPIRPSPSVQLKDNVVPETGSTQQTSEITTNTKPKEIGKRRSIIQKIQPRNKAASTELIKGTEKVASSPVQGRASDPKTEKKQKSKSSIKSISTKESIFQSGVSQTLLSEKTQEPPDDINVVTVSEAHEDPGIPREPDIYYISRGEHLPQRVRQTASAALGDNPETDEVISENEKIRQTIERMQKKLEDKKRVDLTPAQNRTPRSGASRTSPQNATNFSQQAEVSREEALGGNDARPRSPILQKPQQNTSTYHR